MRGKGYFMIAPPQPALEAPRHRKRDLHRGNLVSPILSLSGKMRSVSLRLCHFCAPLSYSEAVLWSHQRRRACQAPSAASIDDPAS